MKRGVLGLLVVLLSVSACTGRADEPAGTDPPAPGSGAALSQRELAYGRAPVPDGGITYRSDVVVVGGGAAMVRSVSGDSLTWSIDARAPHLDELQPGKVMFLTGRAVGRVLKLEPRGDVVAVTLGPVDLTDIISDGDIDIQAPIDAATTTFQTYPGLLGAVESGSANGTAPASNRAGTSTGTLVPASFGGPVRAVNTEVRRHAALRRSDEPMPPPSTGTSTELTVGDYSVELGRKRTGDEDELSLKLGYTNKGVTVGVEFATKLRSPTIEAHLGFRGGALARNELRIDGMKDISVGLISGSEPGLAGNFKSRVEVPAEMTFQLPAGAVPLVASIRFKFIVETAFSARNATLSANGTFKVDGPLGFSGADLLVPTVTVSTSPVDNISGVSVGVNGVVVALQLKLVIGLGTPVAFAGPFGAVTVSYGLTNGSAIGIVQCRQTSIDVVLAGGVGFTLAPAESKLLKLLEVPWIPKLDSELASRTTTVVHRVSYLPKVPVCRA